MRLVKVAFVSSKVAHLHNKMFKGKLWVLFTQSLIRYFLNLSHGVSNSPSPAWLVWLYLSFSYFVKFRKLVQKKTFYSS